MEEKNMIEFTGEEMDEILDYQKIMEFETVQEAIMNAVKVGILDQKIVI